MNWIMTILGFLFMTLGAYGVGYYGQALLDEYHNKHNKHNN